jgi:hypothetical protein
MVLMSWSSLKRFFIAKSPDRLIIGKSHPTCGVNFGRKVKYTWPALKTFGELD